VEKATELGVTRIVPVAAVRSERGLFEGGQKRVERWRRIALESAKQSRRSDVPDVLGPTPLPAAIARESATTRILLSEAEQSLTLASAMSRVPHPSQLHRDGWDAEPQPADESTNLALAIGPEGGWTPQEMSLFTQHEWTHVTLGPRILRAETAAIAAIAIASAHLA